MKNAVRRIVVGMPALLLWTAATAGAQSASAPELKAAFLLNFAKFTSWNGLQAGARVALCVLDDARIGAALSDSVRGQAIDGHAIYVRLPRSDGWLQACHLLYVGGADSRQAMSKIDPVKALPVLTVSDARGFAESGGMIELFQENGRMRFAVNVEAVQRSGLRVSSRVLDLARIVKNNHAQ
jgi:hypothetical protein